MKPTVLLACLAAVAALCSGCADTWGYNHSAAMGAGPEHGTLCRDGTVLPPNSACKIHGGVARASH
jgi:hypothetical protein